MNNLEVLAINTSSKMGEPMNAQEHILVIQDKGLVGDRYENGTGAYSKAPRKNVPPALNQDRDIIRDISIISEEAINAANSEHGTTFTFDDTRRNILVRGIEDLRSLIGVVFMIGGVAMLGIEACDPCDRPSKLSGKAGFNAAFMGRGGLRARALRDGEIKVGDTISTVVL
jgi:hypothetical protein